MTGGKRLLKLFVSVCMVAFPFTAVWSVMGGPRDLPFILLGTVVLGTVLTLEYRSNLFLVLPAVVVIALRFLAPQNQQFLFYYPVLMSVAVFSAFFLSLFRRETLVEVIARMKEGELSPAAVEYCRKVTMLWCVFLALNSCVAAYTVVNGSPVLWMWYNGCVSYLLAGALIAGEYIYRRRMRASLVGFAVLLVFGTAHRAACETDPIFSKPIANYDELDEINSRLRSIEILRATFSQTRVIQALKKPLESNGDFLLVKNRGIAWQVQEPFKISYYLTRGKIRQSDEFGETTEISGKDYPGMVWINEMFLSLFAPDRAALTKTFQVYFDGNKTNWTLGLVPISSTVKRFVRSIKVTGATLVEQVKLEEGNGDVTTIVFRNHHVAGNVLSAEEQALLGT